MTDLSLSPKDLLEYSSNHVGYHTKTLFNGNLPLTGETAANRSQLAEIE